ncbi:MAG: outer membrane protein assembly factor BamD, partial [Deltaproteobacteria bacterium]|nr:outer membrane protein assembly factor BamD [Deltaproteobacteria bacterium]
SIGEFYFKSEKYQAALGRFVSLIKNYPDTGYHTRALEYIKNCQERLAQK